VWAVAQAPQAFEVVVRVPAGTGSWALEVHRDEPLGRATRVSWDASGPSHPVLIVERDDRGLVGVDPPGGQVAGVPHLGRDQPSEVRVVVDTCSVEVFAGGGSVVLTNQVFPARGARGLAVTAATATDVEVTLRDLTTR
jgi:sucrose-6-phosphate hydrolase SacC (GH32 family)